MAKKKNNEQDVPLFQGIDLNDIDTVETISEEQAEKYTFDTVDFSDPNRPKTCLEVDFPILKVNEISAIEQNATKPIYMMSKWWARRRSSVFRQLLISAATKAPKDESKAAQASWSLMYRKNHQKHAKFSKLKVVDIFMGGGTTVVEAARLGFEVTGIDLNPLAWWIVKNETTPMNIPKLQEMSDYIKSRVQPQVMQFFTAKSPRGFLGKWINIKNNSESEILPKDLSINQREEYRWEGPEVIYTFWMKHIMCSDPVCNHLTPQSTSSVLAVKSLKIKFLENCVCSSCGEIFNLEYGDFRMAPSAKLILGENEIPYTTITHDLNQTKCPHCKKKVNLDWISKQEKQKTKKSKNIEHTLLLSKEWLKGITAESKEYFGGYPGASEQQDLRWLNDRNKNLKLIEIRGEVPEKFLHSNFGKKVKTDEVSEQSSGKLICGNCGLQQDPLGSIKLTGHMAPVFPYLIQGFDPEAKAKKYSYGGRFFDLPDTELVSSAITELRSRLDLCEYIPETALFFGHQTHQRTNLPAHGYTKWKEMFNPRQLYVNALILKEIMNAPAKFGVMEKSHALGAWQNYLRHNCMFTIWDPSRDCMAPHFSNNDYHPKATTVENGIFSDLGRGNFASCIANVIKGNEYALRPYDLKINENINSSKSLQIFSEDKIDPKFSKLFSQSSTDLKNILKNESIDLVITDPPFGDNINYSELADFFLVWLHKPLNKLFPDFINSPESPKTLEAISNKARHPGENENGIKKADLMYDRLLTMCWKEAFRVLKPSGIMAFTFHHDKDTAWINVLESLFKAGFIVESAFPIRSDGTKGDGDFGSKKIEYDIVHVCKKSLSSPNEIYWATLRKKILDSVKSRAFLLAQHRVSGLHLADLEVIIRGKVLELYSSHFGKVKKNLAGDLMTVREILLEANNIAQTLLQTAEVEKMPEAIDAETRLLFSLFREGPSIDVNAARKRLKGSGVSLEEFESSGWIKIHRNSGERIATVISPPERWISLSRKRTLTSDYEQAHFAINCCIGDKQFDGEPADLESWIGSNYKSLLPSVISLLKYMESNHFGADYKKAIGMAYRTIERTLNKIRESDGEFKKVSDQLNFFE